ncbi:dystrophin, isoforms A/C/F/G/H-like isoform X42 [Macrobrachium rosenbergii]|uniref:dystrophin, isoforms A/C/F/G/H-like isoform X42 n=1 Tax=Macrobrachium rosenbergii TaxID=79674 RepID=UPI0034D691C1
MSDQGKKPNLRDLTSRLGQIQQRVVTIDPASPNSTPENTGEVRRYVKIDVSEGNNAKACDNVPEGNVSATYGVQESTENEEGDGSTIKEFVHEVEFQHNTLLGKMQMLRDVLAKQLNQSQVQSSLNEAQKDANQSQAEQTQSQLGAVQTPDLQDQSEVVQNMSQTDEREDIQKKTFAKWINSQLVKGQHAPVTDLFYDLRDGTRLLALLEVLTNKTFKREKGRMRVHHLNNVSRALAILEDNNVKLVNISNEHIVDGSAKLTLGLVWAIILHWQVQGVLKDVMSDLQQTNLEKTLLAWCRQTTKGYHGVDVQNFTTSWTDGLAFNALIHSHRPHLFDWTVLARKHPYARLENAFRVAHEHLSIERLLDPEDVNSQVPDKKSIMMYVMCLFQALPHASFTMESLDLSVQSDSSFSVEASSDDVPMSTKKNRPLSNVSIGLGEYQHTLEEVLTWLLGAEDRLAAMPPIAESTDEVKDQFHDLEELMLELTSKQGGIGDVLGEGSRLLREGVMEEEEEEEVRVQMKLLNTRWEELRVKAMDRQSKLHEKLMALQQNQLDSLKRWLTETEDRIANMSQVGPTLEALEEQIAAHQSLQADLEKEQSNINSLSNMVVVVDESSSDAAYSSLEDELNALGERWAHICKWTESRWNMLQNLSVYWKALDQGMVKMRQWMDEKETLLRQVESNPSTEQEHILQQASMLQVLQAELEVQQRCLGHLQEHSANVASHLPSDSDIQEKMSVELENIQDRMDILVSIIEAQTQRLAASGIDITKVVIPGKDSTDVVSSSTTTISSEGGTVVTKIITTKVVTTETVEVEGSGIKRQKLEGGCQEDFSVALHQLGGWMDMIEEKTKPRPVEELTLEQLMQLVQQLESEMETQKEEYYKVVSLGQSAISETSTIGESSQESEKQVAGITTRWEALIEMLVEIRTRVTYLTQKKKISTDLSDLEVHYQEFLRWCDDMQTISENEPNAIKLHLEQCQSKLNAMKNREEELKCIMKAAESLDGKWTQETHILIEEIKIIITKWEVLVQRLFERRKTLTQKVEEVQSASVTPKALAVPPESLLKAIEASREWLCSLETAIASECVVAPLPQMQDVFEKFKDLSQKVDTEQGNMAYINDACNSVSKDSHPEVLESVSKLNNQWELTTSDLKSRIKTIEKLIERQKQYNDEVTGLKSWLAEVDIFLQAEEAALGDIETLEAQLEQSNALQDDIATLQNNFNNISTTGKQLLEEGNEELKTMVKSQLEELTARWDTVTEQARVQNKSLKEALAKSQKVHEDIEKLSTWLDDVEKRIPSSLTTDKEEELNSGIETFSQLRDEISKHSEDFRALNNIGDEMLQLDAAATHEELARQFTQLNGRWTEVVSQVDSKYKTLTTAAQQYEDFKKYCAEEKDWLDQLQAGLEKSTKSAADAEEISEALDELEIFLHSHNEERLEQIRKLAESLVSENVMADSVQEITQSLTTRFETLNAQATEQQSGLEGRVQEAQAWEREYISVLDYLAQSDLLLTQAIADPTLQVDPVQVQSELAVQQEVLKKMQKQVEVYHSQGKTEAAVRLEDQVTHLLKKYEEIEMKLRLVQKPSDFDERLENVSKQLKDIHEKVHLTSIGSGNPDVIQEQLNQCMSIYQLLSEIKAEVENVIATGRKIVKDGQSTDPDGLTQQLDQLKALYNQLGGAVTEQRGTLERTLRHSRKVQKDAGHLEEWLTTTESELDQREATVPTKCIQAELHFAQHAIDDLGRKKPLLTGLHESYAALTSVCDDSTVLQPVKEQVDDIALTWERVSTRLTNRLKNMQSEQVSKEADMEKFIVGLGEIKGWLESTEHQLGNLGKMEPNDQAKLVKAVASEVQNYKSHIENIRDTAVDLINHGTLFQARVQPELVQINQRWENIFKTVQQSSQDTQDTVGDILVLETHEPKPSAGLTNTTTSLSTITDFSSVKETAFLTSLTSDSSQLDQTSGMLERAAEVHLSSQVKEKEEKEQFQVQESHAISRDAESSSTNLVGEQGLLKSIDLVRSVMSTTTTYTTSTTSSSKLFQEPSLDSNNHIQYKEGIQLEETVSADMGSSADSSLWGDSPMVDSVIKVEKKAKSEVLDPSATKDTENSLKACEESTSKQDSQMPDTSEDKNSVNIIEVEEVKMTISHLAFNIPSSSSEEKISSLTKCNRLSSGVADTSSLDSSSRDVSPVPEYPPDESSLKERKRKITESETDLDNFDDLIAGLKEVAEKDIDLTAIEKARRRNSEKEMDLDQGGDERFSLLKIRRRDDDDLESLASVDTDMAPASETSRDFEATFSDLESVSESVSSRGDSLFSPSVTQGCNSLSTSKLEEVRTVEHISQRAQIVTSESVTHPFLSNAKQLSSKVENDTNLFVKLGDEDQHKVMETDVSDNLLANTSGKLEVCNVEVNKVGKDYEQLPVEKLQAMIAELEEVMSDTELSDSDSETKNAVKESSDHEAISSMKDSNKAENLSIDDIVMKDTDSEALPIEFKIQEVHVGDIEFAQAKGSYERSHTTPLEMPFKVLVTSTPVLDDSVNQNKENASEHSNKEEMREKKSVSIKEEQSDSKEQGSVQSVQKVSVHSSQVVHGMTLVSSTENRLPEAEEAVLVTLISRSSSAEAIATDSESTESKNNLIMEQVREENADTDDDIPDFERKTSGNVMKHDEEKLKKGGNQNQHDSNSDKNKIAITPASSSSSSSSDDDTKKTRRPTVIECPAFTVGLDEELTRTDEKKHKEALPSTTQAFQTVTTSETVFAMRSYVKETTKKQSEAGKDDDEGYLAEVSRLAEKIGELRNKTKVTPSYEEALEKAEALEHEVAELEPDIATIISRGDTLTLTTHMVDVHKANVIRTAVNDLRNHWSALKSETEGVKANAEKVNEEVNAVSKKADDIVNWINDVSKRLHLVNNDESQLQALEKEMAKKKEELDDLNNSGALLKKYRYNHIQPILTLLNTRWTEINMQFRQYRKVSLEKKTIVSSSKVEAEVESTNVPDFVASVNRLREAISAISRQLSANKLAGNHYDNLKGQEDELKSIKGGIETLKPRVDGLEEERNATIKNVSPVQSEQVRRVMDKLREEWAQVNRGYTERHSHWLQCSENWRTLQKTIEEFSVWLTSIEEKVQTTASQSLPEAKITQKELEKQVTLKHRPSQTLQSTCKEITDAINPEEGKRLQERVDSLMKRWRSLLLDLAARREKIAGEEGSKEGSNVEYEALVTWVDQAQALMDAPVNVTDEASLSAHTTMVQNHLIEITTKQNLLKKLKDSKSKTLTPSQITLLETNMSKVVKSLPDYKNMMDTKLGVIKTLVTDVEDLYKWTEEMRVKTALHNLSEEEVKMMKITLHEKEVLYENLDSTYWVLAQDAESKGLTVAVGLKNRMNTIESRLKALQGQVLDASDRGKSTSPATSPAFSRITPAPARGTEKADEEKVVQEKQKVEVMKEAQQKTPEIKKTEMRPVSTGTTVTSSVTNVIQNVIKFEESVLSTEGDLRPPSPLVCPPKHSSDSSPALILASLDKSILQIRDWLTLMEQMTRQQTVVVGDAENIRQLTEKQKSVLRELEGKKPQLDELVASADSLKDDASRTQLHQKVSKLREHWDETNSVVLARKTQLDAMYGDTHKFDAKRSELESWLSRMEARLERMAPVAHTADVLDQQIREQKGFHAEIHQYKHQVELFNQMTQRLIAIYQHDDTRKLKKITETINLRYSSLNSSIIARGKALHSAMNSLHNFDKALDKFASWMSDAESNTDLIELEVDKLGPARRDPQARGPAIRLKLAHYSSYDQLQYKDLQSEIESHKDVLASLNATGQKLLGTLENQDEAVMLQRRLEEMNQRWNTLKHKSIAIRNRLEGNAENWNTLLLSLRELIEWVIRKDTELTALGPLVGDLNSLSKFSEDLAAFRRVIDEKQPVIESNLKSGRQLIASEPPLSDTSDSEAGRELDGDARYRGDDSARDLTRSVRREVAKLSEKWAALRERAAAAAAQADLAHKKLGVLQKTVEEVSGRLDEAQKTADGWGPISQDPNLADQHAHNVRKFREGLAELQRGVDDVNDQAARFSAHNVPLTPANSAKLHDLNNRWKNLETAVNDRWRQVASRSREVTPLTPAQLASSVSPPWERATTSNKVPYYINHDQESTHWDHPIMMDLLDSMNEFNHIKFSAYRTATKLRMLQKKLSLDLAKLQMATDVFDEHGLRGQNDRLIDVGDMVVVLSALYANISADHPEVNTTLAIDLCLNWLLNVYDSQRTGQMRVLSFKIGLVCLCCGHLEEKYRYMFRLIADPNRLVDQRKLGLLLHDCVQVPRQLGEVAAFGGSNIEPSVRSCFTKAGKDRETIEAVHFLAWVQQEPQSLVWLAVLHRVAASENIQHQVKCNICKAYPIVGLRYRCLKCLSFDMCQRCFFDGRSGKSHKITHPMHEYCTATTAGEDVKDFTKALKNKFKSKRSLQKHTKKGYLPVQTVLEGDPLESPSPSPQHNVTSQDMHSRLELYASRLAEVELRTNSNSTPDSEDEHGLIAQYCQSLSSSDAPLPVPRSPLQIMAAVDADQKDELEQMIRALEEENSVLQAEYDRLKSQQTVGSPPDDGLAGQRSEADMLAEAKLLRQHKGRLEARMGILEEHNRQLEAQLHRLRQLLGEPGVSSPNKSGTLQTKSVTASQLAMDSPAKVNGHSTQGGATSAYEGLEQMSEYVRPPPPPMGSVAHVGNLFSRAGDLGKAVGTLVATMTHEGASDLPSDEEEDPNASDTEEEKAV